MKKGKGEKRIAIGIFTVLVVLVATVAVLLSRSCQWMLRTWTGLTMEELVYHLNTSLEWDKYGYDLGFRSFLVF